MLFQTTGIFADEIWRDELVKDWRKHIHAAVVDRDAFRAVLGADANKMILAFLQQLDRFEDDRISEPLGSEYRFGSCLIKRFDGRGGKGRFCTGCNRVVVCCK